MATVQLWVAPLDVPAPVLAHLVAALGPSERRRAERYRFADDARRFVAGRGWLRLVLAAELGVEAAEVQLAEGPGKPRLGATGGPGFNLSRAGELVLVALGEGEVGVDVERDDGGRALEAATVACTRTQLAALDRLSPSERVEEALWLWTAKEAYLKAEGAGLSVPPDRVEVGPAAVGATVPVRTVGRAGRARWWVRRLQPRPGYVAAVAAEGPDWALDLREPVDLLDEGVVPGEPIRG